MPMRSETSAGASLAKSSMSSAASSMNAGALDFRVAGGVSKSRDFAGEMTASMAAVSFKRGLRQSYQRGSPLCGCGRKPSVECEAGAANSRVTCRLATAGRRQARKT